MATININEQYRITSDGYGWHVNTLAYAGRALEKREQAGLSVWRPLTSHQTLGAACRALAHRHVRTSDVEGVVAIMAEWNRITRAINDAVMPVTGMLAEDGVDTLVDTADGLPTDTDAMRPVPLGEHQ